MHTTQAFMSYKHHIKHIPHEFFIYFRPRGIRITFKKTSKHGKKLNQNNKEKKQQQKKTTEIHDAPSQKLHTTAPLDKYHSTQTYNTLYISPHRHSDVTSVQHIVPCHSCRPNQFSAPHLLILQCYPSGLQPPHPANPSPAPSPLYSMVIALSIPDTRLHVAQSQPFPPSLGTLGGMRYSCHTNQFLAPHLSV